MKPRIFYTKPSITDLEVRNATDAAANGWGDQCYAYTNRFEELFKEHLSVNYAIATSSCTGALHMGMAALHIGPGDEVILADTNWIATASPIVHLGAKPVFIDILPDSWCIDPAKAEAAITPKTKQSLLSIFTVIYVTWSDCWRLVKSMESRLLKMPLKPLVRFIMASAQAAWVLLVHFPFTEQKL